MQNKKIQTLSRGQGLHCDSQAQAHSRGQGTIEYLVIIGIVVVISLIVVGIATQSTNGLSSTSSNLGKISNSSSGSISIIENVIDSQGDSLVRLQNNSSESFTLNKVVVGTNETFFEEQIVAGSGKSFSLSDLDSSCPCETGQTSVSCTYEIYLTTQDGLSKTERITITSNCIENATPAGNVVGLGSGTLADPWIINSCKELQDMDDHMDGNFALGADIDCTETTTWNFNGVDYSGFSPIGLRDYDAFSGSLDGRGHTIRGLYINRSATDRVGMILQLNTGIVKNLGLIEGYIKGKAYVGSIAGDTVNSARIENVKTNNTVIATGGYGYAGGITGNHTWGSTILNSYNQGDVNIISGIMYYAGGIAGYNNAANIINSYTTGNIKASNNMGGITSGLANYPLAPYWTSSVVNSFSTGKVYGTGGSVRGLIAYITAGSIANLWWFDQAGDNATACGVTCSISTTDTNFYDPNQAVYTGTPAWNDGNWVWSGNDYPKLYWE